MSNLQIEPAEIGLGRGAALAATLIVALTLVGFLHSVTEPEPVERTMPHPTARIGNTSDQAVPPAIAYAQLGNSGIKPNDDYVGLLSDLKFAAPDMFAEVTRTVAMKDEAIYDRSRNRAFDGAPPTIPHSISGQSDASCLACHAQGMMIASVLAPKVSHPHYSSCTQCHVEQTPELRRPSPFDIANQFVGLYRAGPGARSLVGSPPTIPHRTWMRQDCTSCHGLVARPGLRTTHPWLSNCQQCHAASAELDQVLFPSPFGLEDTVYQGIAP